MTEIKKSLGERPMPLPTPETAHFWDGIQAGELRLQQCRECDKIYFPPRPFCPSCGERDVGVLVASGRATLYSYVINQRSMPGFDAPYGICVVELEEGPRMMTNIINCPQTPEALQLDMPLTVVFEKHSDRITLPLFEPAKGQDA